MPFFALGQVSKKSDELAETILFEFKQQVKSLSILTSLIMSGA